MPDRSMIPTVVIAAATAAALATSSSPALLGAQSPETVQVQTPTISGSASSNARVRPDRATVRISVQTRASSAAAAASANAAKQNSVLSALRSLGLANDQLSTADYSVNPEYRYEQNKSPQLIGYTVTNTVLAEVRDLKIVGKVLDTALASGANMISSLDFYASNTDSARKEALSTAIQKARSEAEVAARAAGGTLGSLVALTIGAENFPPPPRPMMRMSAASAGQAEATPVNPGEQTVSVNVTAQWRYVAAGGR